MNLIFPLHSDSKLSEARKHYGYISSIDELPVACARLEGAVVFCSNDKYIYECQHIVTVDEDYYTWIKVTTGGHRVMFIPVEALTQSEQPNEAIMASTVRTSCFDAIASAIDEICLGLYRYGYTVEPLCYSISHDAYFQDGRKYFTYNNKYDRADYVPTDDVTPVEDKTYYLPDVNLHYVVADVTNGFTPGTVYYESKRPQFVRYTDYNVGDPIDLRVFVSNGIVFDQATKRNLVIMVNKLNELIEIINTTGCKLKKAEDDGTLFDLCRSLNYVIDELNPFAHPWNNLLNRVNELERQLIDADIGYATSFDLPITVMRGGERYVIDIRDVNGTNMVVCDKVVD